MWWGFNKFSLKVRENRWRVVLHDARISKGTEEKGADVVTERARIAPGVINSLNYPATP